MRIEGAQIHRSFKKDKPWIQVGRARVTVTFVEVSPGEADQFIGAVHHLYEYTEHEGTPHRWCPPVEIVRADTEPFQFKKG